MKLFFRYGAMNCGKTSALLQVAHNYEEQGMKILLVKPTVDTKGNDTVVSRIGLSRQVDIFLPDCYLLSSMLDSNNLPNAIIVDEAQFLHPEQVDDLYLITKTLNVPVLCYGLRCDFQMKGFPGATRLLEIADDIEEMKTICKCGSKATQNMRLLNSEPTFDGDQVLIDGSQDNITYKAVCGKCYVLQRSKLKKVSK